MMKAQPQVWRRNAAISTFRPFDQTDCSVIKVFVKAGIEKLLGLSLIHISEPTRPY